MFYLRCKGLVNSLLQHTSCRFLERPLQLKYRTFPEIILATAQVQRILFPVTLDLPNVILRIPLGFLTTISVYISEAKTWP